MTDYKPGDVVTLEHDDGSRLLERAVDILGCIRIAPAVSTVHLETLVANGWRVTDHKPKIELPTEPGIYVDSTGRTFEIEAGGFLADIYDPEFFKKRAPFTRLVPAGSEREAAIREVMDLLDGINYGGHWATTVAKHFGFTE